MNKSDNYKNLLEAIKDRKPLILDLGDNVLLYMKWNEEESIYEDEMGKTDMKLIQQIVNGEIDINGKKVEIRVDEG